jgi:hypothetical protein
MNICAAILLFYILQFVHGQPDSQGVLLLICSTLYVQAVHNGKQLRTHNVHMYHSEVCFLIMVDLLRILDWCFLSRFHKHRLRHSREIVLSRSHIKYNICFGLWFHQHRSPERPPFALPPWRRRMPTRTSSSRASSPRSARPNATTKCSGKSPPSLSPSLSPLVGQSGFDPCPHRRSFRSPAVPHCSLRNCSACDAADVEAASVLNFRGG